MLLECNIVQKTSKAGNPYNVLQVEILDKPRVCVECFLNDSDIALLQLKN